MFNLIVARLEAFIYLSMQQLGQHPAPLIYSLMAATYFVAAVISYRAKHKAFVGIYLISSTLYALLCVYHLT